MQSSKLNKGSNLSTSAPQLEGEDFRAVISDAFEKHLPDPSVLIEPAELYAEKLTEAALEKLTPLTQIVRDSVEGVAEARLSLQDQAEVIRSSMGGLSEDLQQALYALEPLLDKLAERQTIIKTESEQLDQLEAMTELRQSLDALNKNLDRIQPRIGFRFWSKRGQA